MAHRECILTRAEWAGTSAPRSSCAGPRHAAPRTTAMRPGWILRTATDSDLDDSDPQARATGTQGVGSLQRVWPSPDGRTRRVTAACRAECVLPCVLLYCRVSVLAVCPAVYPACVSEERGSTALVCSEHARSTPGCAMLAGMRRTRRSSCSPTPRSPARRDADGQAQADGRQAHDDGRQAHPWVAAAARLTCAHYAASTPAGVVTDMRALCRTPPVWRRAASLDAASLT
jgi:hypothetical protein